MLRIAACTAALVISAGVAPASAGALTGGPADGSAAARAAVTSAIPGSGHAVVPHEPEWS
ncbi:hypothetical protein ACF061_14300 [Streptomyces sp. NPDC015220]|uniref:hypothetical protein n=1 Tax=Streptomyces sp. NPDC015220 TaxID=3364947 RepID=UPI003701DFAB